MIDTTVALAAKNLQLERQLNQLQEDFKNTIEEKQIKSEAEEFLEKELSQKNIVINNLERLIKANGKVIEKQKI